MSIPILIFLTILDFIILLSVKANIYMMLGLCILVNQANNRLHMARENAMDVTPLENLLLSVFGTISNAIWAKVPLREHIKVVFP